MEAHMLVIAFVLMAVAFAILARLMARERTERTPPLLGLAAPPVRQRRSSYGRQFNTN